MPRRSIKPFTVEVRSSGRRSAAAAAAAQDDLKLTSTPEEQPRVSWPGLDEAQETATTPREIAVLQPTVALATHTGRVLPALDEAAPTEAAPVPQVGEPDMSGLPDAAEPAGDKDSETAATMAEAEGLRSSGDEPMPTEAAPIPPRRKRGPSKPKSPSGATVPAEPLDDGITVSGAKAVAATLLLRQGRKRLARDDFKRGERWRARLPAAVHRRR